MCDALHGVLFVAIITYGSEYCYLWTKYSITGQVKIRSWMTGILLLCLLAWCSVLGTCSSNVVDSETRPKTASSTANERQSSHEAGKDVARFRELNTKPTGGSSNYQTNLLWCIQLISYRFSISTFRVFKSLESWKFHLSCKSSCYMFVEWMENKVLITLVADH